MLPSNIFTGFSVAQAAIMLTKGIENEEILFGDAGGHTRFAKSVYRATTFDLESFLEAFESDIEDTQEGYGPCEDQTGIAIPYEKLIGSDLTPSLYLTPKPTNGVSLSELVEEVPELRPYTCYRKRQYSHCLYRRVHRKNCFPCWIRKGS